MRLLTRLSFLSATAGGAAILYARYLRPWQLTWGATPSEVSRTLPGDEMVPRPTFNATRAITIDAPPERIWLWLVQVGLTRAGWYSYDMLDNLGRRSARRVIPELQNLAPGDVIPMSPDGKRGMRVHFLDPPRSMIWGTPGETTWVWQLDANADGSARLITRVRSRYRWLSPSIAFSALVEFGDIWMMRKMLLNLRDRVEAGSHQHPTARLERLGSPRWQAAVSRARLGAGHGALERLSPGDLLELVTDVGPVPMNVGAVLTLGSGTGGNVDTTEAVLAQRLSSIPRLRQCLVRPGRGSGRPYWADDVHFDVDAHVSRVACAGPGDLEDLLAVAVETVAQPLSPARPLWRAMVVTGPPDRAVALVVVLHHVLADGIGGLAMLARLVDADGSVPARDAPSDPRPARLPADSTTGRVRMVRKLRRTAAWCAAARAELGRGRGRRAPTCSLNAPTGSRRQVATLEVDLKSLRAAGRRYGATINDALLVAVTGAMADVLRRRGEHVAELVVSVPVSTRTSTTTGDLGNHVGVMPVRIPVIGSVAERLSSVARITRGQKTQTRGASAALIGPAFRLLASAGLFRWFVEHQRLVNSFVTNIPGPAQRLSFSGTPILRIVPITIVSGNVAVAFAALSYAGTFGITVIVDPDVVPEVEGLRAAVHAELQELIGTLVQCPGADARTGEPVAGACLDVAGGFPGTRPTFSARRAGHSAR